MIEFLYASLSTYQALMLKWAGIPMCNNRGEGGAFYFRCLQFDGEFWWLRMIRTLPMEFLPF